MFQKKRKIVKLVKVELIIILLLFFLLVFKQEKKSIFYFIIYYKIYDSINAKKNKRFLAKYIKSERNKTVRSVQ